MQHTSLNAENLPVPTVSKNNKLQTNRKFNNLIIVPSPILTTAIEEKNCVLHVNAERCKIFALFKCQYIYNHKTLYWGCCSYIIHPQTTGRTRLPFPYYVRLRIEIPFSFLFLGAREQHTSFFSNKLINKNHLDAKKGSSNHNSDVDKNGKKAIALDWQNNNFCTFLFHHCTTTFTTWKYLF